VLVRFSRHAIILDLMLKYQLALVSAVSSGEFVVASMLGNDEGHVPPPEQVHVVLLAAEDKLERVGQHLFEQSTRDELCGRWARVDQAVLSDNFACSPGAQLLTARQLHACIGVPEHPGSRCILILPHTVVLIGAADAVLFKAALAWLEWATCSGIGEALMLTSYARHGGHRRSGVHEHASFPDLHGHLFDHASTKMKQRGEKWAQ
jgi:hypothetical protein